MYFFRNAAFAALTVALCACAAQKSAVTATADPSTATAANAKTSEQRDAQLGAPVYPSSVSAGAGDATAKTPDGTMAAFTTHDSFAKVYAFYKTHMPANSQTAKATGGGSSVAAFRLVDESTRERTTVTISEKTGHTDILIMHATAKDATSPEPSE